MNARTEALLDAADRAQNVAQVIEPALARGAIVVSDGYVDSSIAYLGVRLRLGADELAVISQWATRALVPDVTFLLDVPPDAGAPSAGGPDAVGPPDAGAPSACGPDAVGPDADVARSREFCRQVRERLLRLADAEPGRYVTLDAHLAPEELHARIRSTLAARLAAASAPSTPAGPPPSAAPEPPGEAAFDGDRDGDGDALPVADVAAVRAEPGARAEPEAHPEPDARGEPVPEPAGAGTPAPAGGKAVR
jgi:thymidylate kinase